MRNISEVPHRIDIEGRRGIRKRHDAVRIDEPPTAIRQCANRGVARSWRRKVRCPTCCLYPPGLTRPGPNHSGDEGALVWVKAVGDLGRPRCDEPRMDIVVIPHVFEIARPNVWKELAQLLSQTGASWFRCGCRAKMRGHGDGEVVASGPVVVWAPRAVWLPATLWSPGRPFQAAATAIWCLWSFSRLWVAVIRRHSESAADRPRRWN